MIKKTLRLAALGLLTLCMAIAFAGQTQAQIDAQLDSGLTHLWTFENNLDDVVGGLNGTSVGASGFGMGKVGNAVDLTGGYIDIASEVITDQQPQYTWSAWFKSRSGYGYVLETNPNFSMSASVGFYGVDLRTHINGENSVWRWRDDALIRTDWNLIVVTYDGSLSDEMAGSVFINGVLAGNLDRSIGGDITPLASTDGLHIGADRAGTSRFNGLIDEVAIWDRTLSAAEVAELFNGGNGVDLTSLNGAPTAVAGEDQSIRAGDTVSLDGSASFDDNTTTAALDYAWSLTSQPNGSNAALNDSTSVMPSFVADLSGDYVIELTVTDDGGLQATDTVVISSNNQAPTAVATTASALAFVGDVVVLDGTGSSDPDGDAITYSWTITAAPAGSTAQLVDADTASPIVIPDVEGDYVFSLEVSDFLGPNAELATVKFTATTAESFAELLILDACEIVEGLNAAQVTTKGNQNAFCKHLANAVKDLQEGATEDAIDKLNKAIERTDGCPLRLTPDGNGNGRDWITDCDAQLAVYDLLTLAVEVLE